MKKLVALVVVEIITVTTLGVWMSAGTNHGARPNAFGALSYAFVASFSS